MCGRFRLGKGREALKKHFGADIDQDWDPRYNVAPGQGVAAIRQHPTEPKREISLLRWGLIPSWAKEANVGYKMINARSETAAEKPAYCEVLKSRRCLIAADGFYEWKKLGKEKQPYCFTLADEGIFAFAGIWDRWKASDGSTVESCSILTTSANELVHDVHDRMPVIVAASDYDLWLDPRFSNVAGITELLRQYPPAEMRKYPVSSRVNSVQFDDPECAASAIA
jgi:putative SOS response-associated peptidase YedK